MDIQAETERIQSFVARGNYHASINLAISAMNECRRNNDQEGVNTFLRIINDITTSMIREFGSQSLLDDMKAGN